MLMNLYFVNPSTYLIFKIENYLLNKKNKNIFLMKNVLIILSTFALVSSAIICGNWDNNCECGQNKLMCSSNTYCVDS